MTIGWLNLRNIKDKRVLRSYNIRYPITEDYPLMGLSISFRVKLE